MAAEQPAASSQQQFIAAAAAASQRCKDYGYRAEVPQQADSSAKRYMFVSTRGFNGVVSLSSGNGSLTE